MAEPGKPVDLAASANDYMIARRGSDVLMISFGGRFENFNFVNLAARNGFDGLFLRDWNSDWYLSGIRGISDSVDGVAAFIREVMRSGPYRRFLCVGQSSGGYASLRFSLEIQPHACLAFAPQTRPLSTDHRPLNPPRGFNLSRPPDELEDLAQLYRTEQHPFRVQIHLCDDESDNPADAYFWDDWAHIAAFRDIDGVDVVNHPCSIHPVAEYLTDARELDRVVLSILADG